ncbi:hypothetical protein [Halomicrobium salinisoli]|uniref:hypothetical protein n=1 Tax=Halomicrobium salinisoli TaxID=2878391 RepID=UPI001CF044AB|nr:hypothetical protein [Halomicrobium salinisoli]
MSVSPADGPRHSPESDPPDPGETSIRTRVGDAGASLLDRVRSAVSNFVASDDVDPASAALLEEPPGSPSMDDYPDREYPLTFPVRDRVGTNSPDVVALETEDGLRLSVPENSDAVITSDVWTTVDR